jgi:hypothetical protein
LPSTVGELSTDNLRRQMVASSGDVKAMLEVVSAAMTVEVHEGRPRYELLASVGDALAEAIMDLTNALRALEQLEFDARGEE